MSNYDELKSLKERVERTEDNIRRRGALYNLLLLVVLVGIILGIIHLLGYWPEFMKYVYIAIGKLIDIYLQLKDSIAPLMTQSRI